MTSVNSLVCTAPRSLRPVEDADEEIFHLFTSLTEQGKHGLGHTTIHNDKISISVNLDLGHGNRSGQHTEPAPKPPVKRTKSNQEEQQNIYRFPSGTVTVSAADEDDEAIIGSAPSDKSAKRHQSKHARKTGGNGGSGQKSRPSDSVGPIQVVLRQDHTSFRTVAGNTGSVAWRSSFALATFLLRDLHFASQGRQDQVSLLNGEALFGNASASPAHREPRPYTILELGAGTGVLSSLVLAHPAFSKSASASLRWVATDQGEVFELLKRNVQSTRSRLRGSASHTNGENIAVAARELDWQSVLQLAQRGDDSSRRQLNKLRREIMAPDPDCTTESNGIELSGSNDDENDQPDLILAVDCIFNPALFDALLATFALFASGRPDTRLLVVSELREVDMMRSFLEAWTQSGADSETRGRNQLDVDWTIHGWDPDEHPEEGDENEEGLGFGRRGIGSGFVVWLAQPRTCTPST